jgi:hypothetical protein
VRPRAHALETRTERIAIPKTTNQKNPRPKPEVHFLRRGLLLWSALSALLAALSGLLVRLLVLLIRLLLTAALLTTTLAALLVLTTLILIILGHRCLPFVVKDWLNDHSTTYFS